MILSKAICSLKIARRLLIIGLSIVFLSACGNKEAQLESGQETQAAPLPDELARISNIKSNWNNKVGNSDGQNIALNPQFLDEFVYLASEDGDIKAVSLATGATSWKVTLEKAIRAGIGVSDSIVTVALKNGTVVALDTNSGKQVWQKDLGRIISATPIVAQQLVIIRTQDGHVFGLQAASGEIEWGFDRPTASLSIGGDAPSVVAGEGLLTGFSSGRLLASSMQDGQTFWEKRAFQPQGKNEIERIIDMDAMPLLLDSSVIVGSYQAGIASFNVRDGELNWRNTDISTRKDMVGSTSILLVTGSNGAIAAISPVDGSTLWQQPRTIGRGMSTPIVYKNQIWVGGLDGQVLVMDIQSGKLIGQTKLGSAQITNLYPFGDNLLVYSRAAGTLNAIRAQ